MNELLPIIRRARRPLLPVDPPKAGQTKIEPVKGKTGEAKPRADAAVKLEQAGEDAAKN